MEADSDSSSSESEEDPELQKYVNQCVCDKNDGLGCHVLKWEG